MDKFDIIQINQYLKKKQQIIYIKLINYTIIYLIYILYKFIILILLINKIFIYNIFYLSIYICWNKTRFLNLNINNLLLNTYF